MKKTKGMQAGRFAWLPILFFLIAIAAFWSGGSDTVYESRGLLLAFCFLFINVTSIAVLVLVGRSFLAQGSPGLLLLGCGIAFWGTAGTVSSSLLVFGINVTVTVHNILAWLSAICHLAGALLSLKSWRRLRRFGRRAYGGYPYRRPCERARIGIVAWWSWRRKRSSCTRRAVSSTTTPLHCDFLASPRPVNSSVDECLI